MRRVRQGKRRLDSTWRNGKYHLAMSTLKRTPADSERSNRSFEHWHLFLGRAWWCGTCRSRSEMLQNMKHRGATMTSKAKYHMNTSIKFSTDLKEPLTTPWTLRQSARECSSKFHQNSFRKTSSAPKTFCKGWLKLSENADDCCKKTSREQNILAGHKHLDSLG